MISTGTPVSVHEQAAELLKVLSHPVRLRILEILRGGEQCVCHMEAALGLRQAYISQHLIVLRDAGLVSVRREGWNIYYTLIQPGVFEVIEAATSMYSSRSGKRASRGIEISRAHDCPCPKCAVKSAK
jgi:DNA-binding transcriptional ArsR family regulator